MSPRSTFYVYSVMLSCALGLASAFVTGPARGALFRAAIAALVAFLIEIINKSDSRQAKSLLFTYTNSARQAHSHRSHQHSGTCRLDLTGTTPKSLSGIYWTDRTTAGDVTVTLVDRKDDRPRDDALDAAGVDRD